jgi:hypothetical protein
LDSRFRRNGDYSEDSGYESRKQRLDSVSRKKILRQVYEEELLEEDDYEDYEDNYPRN